MTPSGPFEKQGLLGYGYLKKAGALDSWQWWPKDLTSKTVADIGCFTGGLTMYLGSRNPKIVYAVDELPDHLAQCRYLAQIFDLPNIITIESSLYNLLSHIEIESLDMILLSGVLYHLSDMLVGLYMMKKLLKPGGSLIIETNAVNDFKRSYANYGRFYNGMWWQPSGLCIEDMCEHMGLKDVEVRFYQSHRCLVRCINSGEDIPFKRGMNWEFENLKDAQPRHKKNIMAPVKSRWF